MLKYTKDFKDSERYSLVREVIKDWPMNTIESFLIQFSQQPCRQNFQFIQSFTSLWSNGQIANFLAKATSSLYLQNFLNLFKEITSSKQSHQQLELVQQTILLLKNQYLNSHCSCEDCKKRYLERVTVLAMVGLNNNNNNNLQISNQIITSQLANQQRSSIN